MTVMNNFPDLLEEGVNAYESRVDFPLGQAVEIFVTANDQSQAQSSGQLKSRTSSER